MNRRAVARAGFVGDLDLLHAAFVSADPVLRATALGGLERQGRLDDETLLVALTDAAPEVRRRAVELAATRPTIALHSLLADDDPLVAEMAAWACGEHERVDDPTLDRLINMATTHADPLVREAAVAALGAIGDARGLPAVLAGTTDKPAIRRRAVIALVAFDAPEAEAAIRSALADRDWQVRDAAEELTRPP